MLESLKSTLSRIFASKTKSHFDLNGIIIPTESGRYTAFFQEIPNVFAEGDSEKEVKENLIKALELTFEYRRRKALSSDEHQIKGPKKKFHGTLELA